MNADASARAVYCAPLAGHPGAYRVRPADAEPFGQQEAVICRAGDGWDVMWGLTAYGLFQHHATMPGWSDIDTAAQAAVEVVTAAAG
ncbi:hypothetical protein ABZ671_18650 [Micromonospora sp. NPDC006766]|uniref:hypothetical protein n=1 Tax=Micromonospora sp. NPDC006766 TaxID=3154778 RepID=UPI0033D67FD6